METATRKGINILIPDKLYQRGQILTWPRDQKIEFFKQYGITILVNLWPKIDPDLADCDLSWVLHLAVNRSKDIVSYSTSMAAIAVAKLLKDYDHRALILCEAGKTRSVFFSILVVRRYLDISSKKAYAHVIEAVPGHRLKPFMVEYFNNGKS